jgi:hypothetical protein
VPLGKNLVHHEYYVLIKKNPKTKKSLKWHTPEIPELGQDESGELQVQSQPGLHSKMLSQKNKKFKKESLYLEKFANWWKIDKLL